MSDRNFVFRFNAVVILNALAAIGVLVFTALSYVLFSIGLGLMVTIFVVFIPLFGLPWFSRELYFIFPEMSFFWWLNLTGGIFINLTIMGLLIEIVKKFRMARAINVGFGDEEEDDGGHEDDGATEHSIKVINWLVTIAFVALAVWVIALPHTSAVRQIMLQNTWKEFARVNINNPRLHRKDEYLPLVAGLRPDVYRALHGTMTANSTSDKNRKNVTELALAMERLAELPKNDDVAEKAAETRLSTALLCMGEHPNAEYPISSPISEIRDMTFDTKVRSDLLADFIGRHPKGLLIVPSGSGCIAD